MCRSRSFLLKQYEFDEEFCVLSDTQRAKVPDCKLEQTLNLWVGTHKDSRAKRPI